MAALVLGNFQVPDYDTWKQMFDSDPAGRAASGATSHAVSRDVDDGNSVFVRLEFPSVDQAKAFSEKLLASGALDNVTVKMGPTIVEVAEEKTY